MTREAAQDNLEKPSLNCNKDGVLGNLNWKASK